MPISTGEAQPPASFMDEATARLLLPGLTEQAILRTTLLKLTLMGTELSTLRPLATMPLSVC